MEFFYDSYALIEFMNASQNYKKYFLQYRGITTKLNLTEVYYSLLKEIGEEKAEIAYDSLLALVVDVDDDTIKRAMKLRLSLRQKNKKLSYIDAIGYQISLDRGLKFLTGDKEFEELDNVEFVK